VDEVVGREQELGLLHEFLEDAKGEPQALLLEGDAGIGKTTLWKAAADDAEGLGFRRLASRPGSGEAQLSFAGLTDLLEPVIDELPGVPPPQRQALEVALLRASSDGPPPEPRAIALAFLGAIRSLAEQRPVLVAVDDVQWLDGPSADALAFAARRFDSMPVALLVARRVGPDQRPAPMELDRAFPDLRRIRVGPLPLGALHQLLRNRLGITVPRPTLIRLHQISGGNPFFALELARALDAHDARVDLGQALPSVASIQASTEARIQALPKPVRQTLLAVAALSDPTVELVEAGSPTPEEAYEHLLAAVGADVVEMERDRVRFTHPLLAEALLATTGPRGRHTLHRRLADVVPTTEERALHLALGTERADAEVAAFLEEAASEARNQGATVTAARLYEHAARLTPRGDDPAAVRRAVRSSMFWTDAEDQTHAGELLDGVMVRATSAELRTQVMLARARLVPDRRALLELANRAVADAHEDHVGRARALLWVAYAWLNFADLPPAAESARAAVDAAELAGHERLLVAALSMAGRLEAGMGDERGRPRLRRALELEDRTGPIDTYEAPGTWLSMAHLWADEIELARPLLERQYRRALEYGDDLNRKWLCLLATELEVRAGDYAAARRYADEGLELAEQSDNAHSTCALTYAAALVDAHTGHVENARVLAERGTEMARSLKADIFELKNLSAWGYLALSVGDHAEAVRHLEGIPERLDRGGIAEWTWIHPFAADLIESLVAVGETSRAKELLDRVERFGREHDRPSHLAAASRCRGLLEAQAGDVEGALRWFDRALEFHDQRPIPLEQGRTLLARGAALRRSKRKGPAREALQAALAAFEQLGAPLWAERARSELARIGGRAPAPLELTETERRVAELVATGLSNREVARALFVSESTVHANLKRVFVKLGVRSRTELAARLAAGSPGE